MPKMKHSSGGRQIEVAADRVAMYESQGWVKVEPTKKAATVGPKKK